MATVNYSVVEVPGDGFVVKWLGLATGDVGQTFTGYGGRDRSVQFKGVFGGATAHLKGANVYPNPVTADFNVLTDPQGNAISKVAADLEAVAEATAFVRPEVVAGAGVAIDVYMFIGAAR